MRAVALGYIAASGARDAAGLAFRQFEQADNMTDRQGALTTLVSMDCGRARRGARHLLQPLFGQSAGARQMVLDPGAVVARRHAGRGRGTGRHPDFTLANPNRARSLVGAFSVNQRAFHARRRRAAIASSPTSCSRSTSSTRRPRPSCCRRSAAGSGSTPTRAALMRAELERIVAHAGPVQGHVRAGVEEPGLTLRRQASSRPRAAPHGRGVPDRAAGVSRVRPYRRTPSRCALRSGVSVIAM